MTQSLISLLILGFIVITHILVWKWAAYIQEKYADDARKRRIAGGHPFYVPCGIVRFVRALSHAIFFLNIAKSRKDRIGRDTAFYFIGAFWFYCYDSPSGQQMGSIFSRATRKRPAANTKRHFDDYAPHHSHFPDCSFIFVSNFSINIT